jgi:glycine amidinotransferase
MTVVSSYNEWDPLEEVIVGTVRGSVETAFEPSLAPFFPPGTIEPPVGGRHDPDELAQAEAQLDGFARLLEEQGVVVRRPAPVDHEVSVRTPDFEAPYGHGQACPRDVLLVVGDEIIEAPMAQRGRFFEYRAYRDLLTHYFRNGARWTTAPKPRMGDELYHLDYLDGGIEYDHATHPLLTEVEPAFDAACFARCGRDIFWQPDLVSNDFGAAWLQRHLGNDFTIHVMEFVYATPQHIDTTFVPVRPGLAIANRDRPCTNGMDEFFERNGWRIVYGPPSVRAALPSPAHDVSNWISLNILMLDPHTAVVESAEEPLIELLEQLDCRVLHCDFDKVYKFGGGFHCCTVDVRRRGGLRSYFPLSE